MECLAKGVAFIYSRYCHFDFKALNFQPNVTLCPWLYFLTVSLMLTSTLFEFDYVHYRLFSDYVVAMATNCEVRSEIQAIQYSFWWAWLLLMAFLKNCCLWGWHLPL